MVEDAASVSAFAGYTAESAAAASAPPAAAAAAAPSPPPAAAAAPRPAAAAPAPPPRAPAPTPAPPPPPPPPPTTTTPAAPPTYRELARQRVFASPLARRTALDAGLSLLSVAGTGPGGRVVAADVAAALASRAAAPPPPPPPPPQQQQPAAVAAAPPPPALGPDSIYPPFVVVPLSNVKRVTARRLAESKQTVPHFYLSVDVRMDALLAARAALNAAGGSKVSVNDFVVMAAARACAAVPDVNAAWAGEAVGVRKYAGVDVSVAVQTDAGLMVPVVRGAHAKARRARGKGKGARERVSESSHGVASFPPHPHHPPQPHPGRRAWPPSRPR